MMANEAILRSSTDFKWHKKKLDADGRYEHRHSGEPERYPCVVYSHWGDDPNGPYFFDHEFIYQVEITCDHCGSRSVKWPHELPNANGESGHE